MAQDRGVVEYDEITGLPTSSPGGARQDEPTAEPSRRRKPPPETARGPLLDKAKKDAAKLLNRMWEGQDRTWKSHRERWKANRLRMEGVLGVQLVRKKESPDEVQAYAPPGGHAIPPMLNKMARNARRLLAMLYADPPMPEGVPSGGPDHNPEKAEFATRVLQEVGGESGIDDLDSAKEAVRAGFAHGSGFRRYWTDPKGGGHRPREIMAHPAAPTEDAALVDPATGQPAVTFEKRFVGEDGTLTDDPEQAELEWLPKLCVEVGDGRQVRPIPEVARHIGECDGLMWRCFVPFSDLRAIAPKWAAALEDEPERAKKILGYEPQNPRDFLPDFIRETEKDIKPIEGESDDSRDTVEIPDDHLVLVTMCWYTVTPSYPKGCYILVAGEEETVYRSEWVMEDGKKRDIPVDQFKQFSSWSRDFYGMGLADLLGNMGELVASILSIMLEHLDRFSTRKTFIPMTSNLTPKLMESMTGSYVPYSGEKPSFEDIPDLPAALPAMLDRFLLEHDEEAGIGGPGAQGGSDPNIQSGLHQQQVMEAVAIGLSDVKQNTEKGHKRGWRIQLQEVKEGFTTEQELSWVGEDGQYKQQAFHGSDLTGTKEITMAKGSFTGMTPSAKMAIAEHAQSLGLLTTQQLKKSWMGNQGGLLGVQDDPHYQRVKRQIAEWEKGPPEGYVPPMIQSAPATMDPSAPTEQVASQPVDPLAEPLDTSAGPDAQMGAPTPGMEPGPSPDLGGSLDAGATGEGDPMAEAPPAPPVDPNQVDIAAIAAQIFDALPIDDEPEVALMRAYELGYAIAGAKFKKFAAKPWWQGVILGEYQRAWFSSGQKTVQQQMEEAQMAADAQAQAAQTEQQGAAQQAQADADAQSQRNIAETQAAEQAKAQSAPVAAAGVQPNLADPTTQAGQLPEIKDLLKANTDAMKAFAGIATGLAKSGAAPITINLPSGKKQVIRDEAGVIQGVEPI